MYFSPWLKESLMAALKEDIVTGDVTTELVVAPDTEGCAEIISRESGILAGIEVAREVFRLVDDRVVFVARLKDGDRLSAGALVAEIKGALMSVLIAERTVLNYLQNLSGIATITSKWVNLIRDYPAQLLDTRKTTPGLRHLEKYAVMVGGGRNHRKGLFDGVLIKENHIVAAGGIKKAVERAKNKAPLTLKIEVEVANLTELEEAIEAGADIVMLDNMDIDIMRKAVEINNGRVLLEASGNITDLQLEQVAATGVNFISSGALTYAAKALDLSLLILSRERDDKN